MTNPKNVGGLGFRDMELFNIALVSCQAWRLLQDPWSLSARLLKAIYFPNTSIIEAELGSSPSQIWRSIVDGRDTMLNGIIRRIGDETTTHIWEHNWLPRDRLMRPISSRVANPPQYVSELTNATTASWREDIVRDVSVPLDAKTILKTPLCMRQIGDFWAWSEDPRGRFSVSSTYKMMSRIKASREAWLEEGHDVSNSAIEKKGWSSI